MKNLDLSTAAALAISTKGQFHLALKKAAVMRSNRQTLMRAAS
jgi:hypothetical protein